MKLSGARKSALSLVWDTSDARRCNKNEKIQEGALKRYVGWGRVPTKNVGACAKGRLMVLS
jgi:hypothetical protein